MKVGTVLYSHELLGREHVVIAKINKDTNSWQIVTKEGVELTAGQGKTLTLAKSGVKKALQVVGVNFLSEMRVIKPSGVKTPEGEV